MTRDTWIYCLPAAWDALAPATEDDPVLPAWAAAKTGYWNNFQTIYQVYNTNATDEDKQALVDALEAAVPASVARVFSWGNMTGFDDLEQNQTIPDDVIAVMKDHKTYDEQGNETSSTPATADNPNFGHGWAGQRPRIIAGFFNEFFSEGFR